MKAVFSTARAAVIGAIFLVIPQSSWGQGKQIPNQTAQPGSTQDFSRARWMPPLSTVAALPSASTIPNRVYIVTNGNSETDCTVGGGTDHVWCQAVSGTWTAIGGGGGGGGGGDVTANGTLTDTAFITGDGTTVIQAPSATSTLDAMGNAIFAGTVSATGVNTGTSPPDCFIGSAGTICLKEGTAATAEAAADICYGDSTNHDIRCSYNGGLFFPLTRTIASGAKALATSEITGQSCTSAQTATATGALSTDSLNLAFSADPTAVTGYAPLTTGGLYIAWWFTADTLNFKVCNPSGDPITPGAITINWRLTR